MNIGILLGAAVGAAGVWVLAREGCRQRQRRLEQSELEQAALDRWEADGGAPRERLEPLPAVPAPPAPPPSA